MRAYKYPEKDKEYRDRNKEKIKIRGDSYYQKNRERILERMRLYRKNNKALVAANSRKARLKKDYKITPEDFSRMIKDCDNKCNICTDTLPTPGEKHNERAHIDHCHETNAVRGILCPSCNKGLGFFRDNTDVLKKAIKYLEKYKQNVHYIKGG